jgi:hypothetical protein
MEALTWGLVFKLIVLAGGLTLCVCLLIEDFASAVIAIRHSWVK